MKKEFFNLRASEKISLWRSIPDTRDSMYVVTNFSNNLNLKFSLDVVRSIILKIYRQLPLWSFSKMNVGHQFFVLFILFWIVRHDIYWKKWFLSMINPTLVSFRFCRSNFLQLREKKKRRGNGTTSWRLLWRTFWRTRSNSTCTWTSRTDQSQEFRCSKRSVVYFFREYDRMYDEFQPLVTLSCFLTLIVKPIQDGE